MEPLTEKQRKIFEFIETRLGNNKPPSQREIAERFGLAQNSVYQLIGYLRKKGYLTDVGGHRGLRLSKEYAQSKWQTGIPIVGQVAAGEPILAEQNIEGHVDIQQLLGLSNEVFLLRVRGDSMVDEGIMDGDLVAVKRGVRIEEGQIAVILLDDEVTVKRVLIQKNRIVLKPANRKAGYKTMYIRKDEKDIHIAGKVVACLRRL
jgi:repressor LexA